MVIAIEAQQCDSNSPSQSPPTSASATLLNSPQESTLSTPSTSDYASSATAFSGRRLQREPNEAVVAVMGATGSGKTTLQPIQFINTVSGSQFETSDGLYSCTSSIQSTVFTLDGRIVTLIDTPGFDDTTRSEAEVLRMITQFLVATYERGTKLAGVIYIHKISDLRMTGVATRNFRVFRELCGSSTLKNVVIVTNMWGAVTLEAGSARERGLATDDTFFKPALDKGAQMMRHDYTVDSAQTIIRYFFDNNPVVLQIQRELVDEKKDILQTSAGMEMNKQLSAELERHRKEMKELMEEWKAAGDVKEQEAQELEVEREQLQKEIDRIRENARRLAADFQKEKAELEQYLKDMHTRAMEEQREKHRSKLTQLKAQKKEPSISSTMNVIEGAAYALYMFWQLKSDSKI
ncbi:hypothetical protein H1R20_g10947, partial [Candolleomyces eurysporus]